MEKLKKLVKVADFFYSTQMLRYDDDLQYKTLTGGIVSLGIIVTILVGFASMILNTLDLNTFTISTEIVKNKVPTPSVVQINKQSPFRFAIQIWRQNITDNKRYFDITFQLNYQNYGSLINTTYFPLQACSKEHFSQYPDITNNFDRLYSSTWLCPTLNNTLNLFGKYSSENYNQYIIAVSACKNETDPSRPCASPEEIQNYFLQNQNFFYFVFYFTNTQINPDKKDYKQYYIEDQSYALFGSNVGTQTFLYLTDYTVQTDYSIWPFSKISKDLGVYAEDLGINHPYETNINGTYITWNIAKSTNSIVYTRQVQKLSIVFSFMGGMIGAVSAVLFIIKIYTNVAFQFSIAFEIFKQKQPQSKKIENGTSINENQNQKAANDKKPQDPQKSTTIEEMSMNFFNFVAFHAYQLLDLIGYKYESPRIRYAQRCKQQILKQLDVKKLLKRIIFIQHCLTNILDDYQLDALQLKRPQTPQQIKEIRLKCESVVDNQLDQSDVIKLDQSQKHMIGKSEMICFKLNQDETPSNLVKFNRNQPKKPDKETKSDSPPINGQVVCKAKNQILIFDIENSQIEKTFSLEASQSVFGPKRNNKVIDEFRKQKKRQSNMAKLLSTVQEGDEISNKIWRKLDKQIKKKAIKDSKLQFEQ